MSAGRRADLPPPRFWGETHRHAAAVGALAAAAIFAGVASGARPFTIPADVAISVPSALLVAALVMERLRPVAGPWRRMDRAHPEDTGGTAVPWLVVAGVLVGVELASYFHPGLRADYPTISSGIDALFHYRAAKAGAWFAWLLVGWYLVRR
jgi:hypothetical protein